MVAFGCAIGAPRKNWPGPHHDRASPPFQSLLHRASRGRRGVHERERGSARRTCHDPFRFLLCAWGLSRVMREVIHRSPPLAAEIDGSPAPRQPSPEGNFQPGLFGDFARLAYPPPHKVDAVLADIGKVTDRAARAWMSGSATPPPYVAAVCFVEIMRRCRCK